MRIPGRTLSSQLTTAARAVHMIEAIDVTAGDHLTLTFESSDGRWKHGVWLGLHGVMRIAADSGSQFAFWEDSAPQAVSIEVLATDDGSLRFYNIWDSGRGLAQESQSATSGMVRESIACGWRYHCNDIGLKPDFTALVFRLEHV